MQSMETRVDFGKTDNFTLFYRKKQDVVLCALLTSDNAAAFSITNGFSLTFLGSIV